MHSLSQEIESRRKAGRWAGWDLHRLSLLVAGQAADMSEAGVVVGGADLTHGRPVLLLQDSGIPSFYTSAS